MPRLERQHLFIETGRLGKLSDLMMPYRPGEEFRSSFHT
jgi:hypothetical protein